MTQEFEIAIVAPLHIPPTKEWIESLERVCKKGKKQVIIVDDSKDQNLKEILPHNWEVITRELQREILGEKYEDFKVFQKSSACKNIGHYVAYQSEADIIIGLDSDCNVPSDFIGQHIEGLLRIATGWTNPIAKTGWFPRGYPYAERTRRTIANIGLWNNKLDLGGADRVANQNEPSEPMNDPHAIADGFLPYSGMNWAMWREGIPGLLFLPNFEYAYDNVVHKFRRHDDIWGGYIFQKLMELRNERICYGDPVVYHDTIIDAQKDADEEKGASEFENTFYIAVDQAITKIETIGGYDDMFYQFSKIIERDWNETEFHSLIAPIKFWASLFT
jgi:hypothetical protein